MTIQGIDVSRYQRDINWEKVKQDGIEFVIIRAGYGRFISQIDPCFQKNAQEASAAGLPIGAYWYSYAVSIDEARQEAQTMLQAVRGYRFLYPLFFDQEYEPGILALSTSVRTEIAKAFLQEIEQAGDRAGIYGSKDWLENKLDMEKLSGFPVWVAQYASQNTYRGHWDLWQYSGSGAIDGIVGSVDRDVSITKFTDPKPPSWEHTANGWRYGNKRSEWAKIDGRWYWFDQNGYAVVGWQTIDGKIYYFSEQYYDGAIKECQLVMTNSSGAVRSSVSFGVS